ncbi:MAG: AAA family ATPase [Deltaproteobacteria bacterium]|nr:AAA family ATPase [Deltaproteobacteria bacterium]
MYEEFYGLKEKPFNLTPDPRFFFLSENHRGAFEHLLYGIKEREGFILITGEVGAGKTTLCRALLNKIESQSTDSALVLNPMFSGQELLQCILGDFGIQSKAMTKKELLDELNQFLLNQQAANRNSILIIDEAQNLPLPVLEEIRILSNLETEKEKLLQIILMGQVELKEKLSLPRLRQLNQRISIRYHLQPLGREEVPRYIQHRLTVAGSSGDIHFTQGALREIYHYSQGIPRLINLASDRALLGGYAEQNREIQRQTVIKGLKSLEGEEAPRSNGPFKQRLTLGLAALAIFFLGIFSAFFFLDSEIFPFKRRSLHSSPPSADTRSSQERPQGNSFYTIQLGSYKTEAEALEVAERVKSTGYPLFLAKADAADGGTRHRLYLGQFAQRAEADEVERTFKRVEGFSEVQVVLTSTQLSKKAAP